MIDALKRAEKGESNLRVLCGNPFIFQLTSFFMKHYDRLSER